LDVYAIDSVVNDHIRYALDQQYFAVFVGDMCIRMTIPEMPALSMILAKMNETNNRDDHKQAYKLSKEVMDIYSNIKDLKRMECNYWINGKRDYGESEVTA
jgi:hypothetical protein